MPTCSTAIWSSTDLRTKSYVFTSSFSDQSYVSLTLPVPNGTYLVSYSNFFSGMGSSPIQCFVQQDNATGTDPISGWSSIIYTNDDSWKPALTGTGLATKSVTSQIVVVCGTSFGGATFSTSTAAPMEVIATPTTIAGQSALTPGSPSLRGAPKRLQR